MSRKPGEPLVMEEIIVAPPMPHEVRIRIICTSLCHSDIIFWKMKVAYCQSIKYQTHTFFFFHSEEKKIVIRSC